MQKKLIVILFLVLTAVIFISILTLALVGKNPAAPRPPVAETKTVPVARQKPFELPETGQFEAQPPAAKPQPALPKPIVKKEPEYNLDEVPSEVPKPEYKEEPAGSAGRPLNTQPSPSRIKELQQKGIIIY